MPNLNLTQITKQKSMSFIRHFTNDNYNKFNWICGYEVRSVVFCFPSLLIGRKSA